LKYETEYKFDSKRKWRFDYCIPDKRVAIEYEGAVFTGGAHTRGMGYSNNCEKYNAAAIQGWKVLRYTVKSMRKPKAVADEIVRAIMASII
jgi:very-short-patch-repair endonuclease